MKDQILFEDFKLPDDINNKISEINSLLVAP